MAASWLVGAASSDLLTEAPAIGRYAITASLVGLGLCVAVHRNLPSGWCRWIAIAGWLSVIAGAAGYVAVGVRAHRSATAGPTLRAQIAAVESHGRRFKSYTTSFALQDGTTATTSGFPAGGYGNARRCFRVHRLDGPNGFAWLRIVEASPLPGAGQLAWPIARADCFSDVPLATLRG